MTVFDLRRAGGRFHTRLDWLNSRHSFSFGRHYDPGNTHFGLLLVSNDDVVESTAGFDTHPHRDMEIVTWVLDGALVHQDSEGHSGIITPGLAQRMSAGTGILHSERNDAGAPVRFVQMWVAPDGSGTSPGYAQLDITGELDAGGLVTVASGMARHRDTAAIPIRQRHAALHAARLAAGQSVPLPDAPYAHLYVARGSVDLEGAELEGADPEGADLEGADLEAAGRLGTGDTVRLTAAEGQRLTAVEPAEILVWEMHAAL